MHTELTLNLVRLDLQFDTRPKLDAQGTIVTDAKGKIVFEPNERREPYIVFDTSRDAPRGFGIKVGATGKSFLIQVRDGKRVIKSKIGNVRDFQSLKEAYEKGFEFLKTIKDTGRNPNAIEREKEYQDLTLGEIFEQYIKHLKTRAKPATENSINTLEKGIQRLSDWHNRRVSELTSDEIKEKFLAMKAKTPTAAEQTMRWASAAIKYKIKLLLLEASKKGVVPHLVVNPFDILQIEKMYRGREELERAYKEYNRRNPISSEQLGAFINTLWDKRPFKHTATDYLLCGLLWGCRKSEHRVLQWKELVPKKELATTSWVDLKEKKIFFYKTKNGSDHELPLAPMALRLLQMRQEQLAEEFENTPSFKGHTPVRKKFVFPAQNKTSKTGCYTDPTEMLASVMRDAGIEKVTPHDLRRSFGRVAESLNINESMISKLLNHGAGSVTRRYTEAEWRRLSDTMERIEQTILATAPRVYNALRPLSAAPIPEDDWVGKPYRKYKRAQQTELST